MRKFLAVLLLTSFFQSSAFAGVVFTGTAGKIISLNTDDILTENGACTISVWFYATGNGENNECFLVARGGSAVAESIRLQTAATRGLYFVFSGGTFLVHADSASAYSDNTWNHAVVTWDGSVTAANAHIYLNGTELTYDTEQNGVSLSNNVGYTTTIGDRTGGGRSCAATIQEVAAWGSVLTAPQLSQLFSSKLRGSPLMIGSPLFYLPLDECGDGVTCSGANQFRDLSGNARHGAASGSPVGAGNKILNYPSEALL